MAYTLIGPGDRASVPEVHDAEYSPLNPEGRPYRYCLMMPNGEDLAYGDTLRDLVDALVPGHEAAETEEDKAELRIWYAARVAATVQSLLLAQTDPNLLDDYVWATVTAPKTGPNVARADWWTSPIPLVVVDTSYTPYTDVPRPASNEDGVYATNLWWLTPATSEELLFSLESIGHIRLLENFDLDPIQQL